MVESLVDLNLLDLRFLGLNVAEIGKGALVIIMVTMGLTLTLKDFLKIYDDPRGVVVGLTGQLVVLPVFAFLTVWFLSVPPVVAISLIILACCPGGATSNFFSFLARGDVALSIVLTTISGLIVVFTIPILVNLALEIFNTTGKTIRLPVIKSMLRIFMLVIAPVAIGMAFRSRFPKWAVIIEPYATKISFAAVLSTMAVLLAAVWPLIPRILVDAGLSVVLLNVSMMAVGFVAALALKAGERQSRTICIEIGVQNYLLSVIIAVDLLRQPEFAIAPVIYLFTMYVTVFSFIGYCRFLRDRNPAPARMEKTFSAGVRNGQP